ncbi:MAG TPA: cellulose synthase family protein [Thermoanaerobaculia bacterium]|jgi:cellulose synthase/poly-beta-1,6-N-acetylglucosamine synthase-like glycosyltransferase|nr:cellulose synthase family protein [Thermoanaerobaculia bacterium]
MTALSWIEPALLATYYSILTVLAFFGIHRFLLVMIYLRTRKLRPVPPPPPAEWPVVTVQLPLYNEMYVAERLIDAVCRLDYPRDRLEIQVLDDSTDETKDIVARVVERYRGEGIDIRHLHRTDRGGFKAGALEAGFAQARGELLAVFDADFLPEADFLRRSVPCFADPKLGLVQGCWDHINRGYSLLTRIEAILLDGHFMIEHSARNRTGCFFNFNGTAGIWRRQAILEGGGWQHDTLTEDLDLSYRAQLAGWKFLYLPDLTVPSELPVDINGFKSQQYRWAKGAAQTGRKLLGRVFRAPLPARIKFEALVHLTNNSSYVLMIILSLLIFPAMVLRRGSSTAMLLLVDLPLFLGATLSVVVFYLASQLVAGKGWRQIFYIPALLGLGIGLSVNNARAVVSGLLHEGGTFERTPKYSIVRRGQDWQGKRYKIGPNLSVLAEVILTLYFTGCTVYAYMAGMWMSIPFLFLFVHGYGYMATLSLKPAFLQWWARRGDPSLVRA